jgi:hypothetical protein
MAILLAGDLSIVRMAADIYCPPAGAECHGSVACTPGA